MVIVGYSATDPKSLKHVEDLRVPEVRQHCPDVPMILVGMQIDLRNDIPTIEYLRKQKQSPITFEMGFKKAKELGFAKYCECSALTQEGLKNIFDEAIRAVLAVPIAPRPSGESKTKSTIFKTLVPCIKNEVVSDDKSISLVEELLETTSARKAFQIAEEISKNYPDLKIPEIQVGKVVECSIFFA